MFRMTFGFISECERYALHTIIFHVLFEILVYDHFVDLEFGILTNHIQWLRGSFKCHQCPCLVQGQGAKGGQA